MDQNRAITVDAHTLLWYMHKDSQNLLSEDAMNAMQEAESQGTIYIPIIAMLEILWIIEKGKYPISFNDIKNSLYQSLAFDILPLTYEIMEASEQFRLVEIHDRIIIATSIVTNTDLVSNDRMIHRLYKRAIW